jgi:hypothetical protein
MVTIAEEPHPGTQPTLLGNLALQGELKSSNARYPFIRTLRVIILIHLTHSGILDGAWPSDGDVHDGTG